MGSQLLRTYEVVKNANKMIESADDMASIKLNEDEKRLFAESARRIYPTFI
jgi:hypothetical protein